MHQRSSHTNYFRHVTKTNRCGWCGGVLVPSASTGRPRRYCRRSCRQRAYEVRAHARQLGLVDDTVLVAREEFERLTDMRFVVTTALADYDRSSGDGRAVAFLVDSLRESLT